MLSGNRVGRIPPEAGVPPIVHDFDREARRLRLPVDAVERREMSLDLYRNATHRQASRLFHRLDLLGVPFAGYEGGPDFVHGAGLDLLQERWRICWSPGTESALIEAIKRTVRESEVLSIRFRIGDDGETPQGLAVSGGRVHVVTYGAGGCHLHSLALSTGVVVARLALPACKHGGGLAAIGGGRMVVADTHALFVVAGGAVVRHIALTGELRGSFADFDGTDLWIGSYSTSAPGKLWRLPLAALQQVAPRARDIYLQAIRQGQPLFDEHGITTPQRMAHFLAQAMQETGAFTVLRESMSYSAPRMLEIFGVGRHSARITEAEAPGLAHNEPALAERVYGLGNPSKAAELGNTKPGDGFLYRGNGVLQTTGRGNHRRTGEAVGVDFEGHPELVTVPEHALKPALHEWTASTLNRFADQDDIRTITLRINGGLNGFDGRKAFLAKLRPLLS